VGGRTRGAGSKFCKEGTTSPRFVQQLVLVQIVKPTVFKPEIRLLKGLLKALIFTIFTITRRFAMNFGAYDFEIGERVKAMQRRGDVREVRDRSSAGRAPRRPELDNCARAVQVTDPIRFADETGRGLYREARGLVNCYREGGPDRTSPHTSSPYQHDLIALGATKSAKHMLYTYKYDPVV